MRALRLPVLLVVLTGTAPVVAHHSVLGFDSSRSVTLHGRVAAVVWKYPHVFIAIDTDGVPEGQARWVIESEAPPVLERLGWNAAAVRGGDRMTASGAPSRDGARRMRCDTIQTAAGLRLPCYPPGRTVHFK
jgi:hypothetical protein